MVRTSEGNVVEVIRCLYGLHLAANIVVLNAAPKVRYGGVCGIICAEYLYRLLDKVRLVDILHYVVLLARISIDANQEPHR